MLDLKSSDAVTLSDLFVLIKKHAAIYLLITAVSFLVIFLRIKSQYNQYHVRQNFLIRGADLGLDLAHANQFRKTLERDPEILNQILVSLGETSHTLDQLQRMLKVKIRALDDYETRRIERVPQFGFSFSVINSEKAKADKILEVWSSIAMKYFETRRQNTVDLQQQLELSLQNMVVSCAFEKNKRIVNHEDKINLESSLKKIESNEELLKQNIAAFKKQITTKVSVQDIRNFYELLNERKEEIDKSVRYYDELLSQCRERCNSIQSRIKDLDQKLVYLKPLGSAEVLLTPHSYFLPAVIAAGIGSLILAMFGVSLFEQVLRSRKIG